MIKKSVQHKIDLIRQLATTPVPIPDLKDAKTFRASNDSLSKSIRNKEEADVFLAELNAVIQIARNK